MYVSLLEPQDPDDVNAAKELLRSVFDREMSGRREGATLTLTSRNSYLHSTVVDTAYGRRLYMGTVFPLCIRSDRVSGELIAFTQIGMVDQKPVLYAPWVVVRQGHYLDDARRAILDWASNIYPRRKVVFAEHDDSRSDAEIIGFIQPQDGRFDQVISEVLRAAR